MSDNIIEIGSHLNNLQKSNNVKNDGCIVRRINNKPMTTSILVAEIFEKRHDNIIQAVRNVECSEKFRHLNFQEATYIDEQGKPRIQYDITKDGFTFLAMGFTGPKAAQFKEDYINAFNAMEKTIQKSRHIARVKSPQEIFQRNYKVAILLFTERQSRLSYANEKTLEQTGFDVMADAGVQLSQDNPALKNLLNKSIDGRTIKELLDAVHYRHEDHRTTNSLLIGLYIKLVEGRLHIGNKCPLVDDRKALQIISGATCNVTVWFKETCKATVIPLY